MAQKIGHANDFHAIELPPWLGPLPMPKKSRTMTHVCRLNMMSSVLKSTSTKRLVQLCLEWNSGERLSTSSTLIRGGAKNSGFLENQISVYLLFRPKWAVFLFSKRKTAFFGLQNRCFALSGSKNRVNPVFQKPYSIPYLDVHQVLLALQVLLDVLPEHRRRPRRRHAARRRGRWLAGRQFNRIKTRGEPL